MVMSDHIRYSICSTHYNNVEYIEDSAGYIASVIKDRPQWELVISDAGSTDGSLEFLQELSKDRDDVRIIMAEGSSIGKGRQVARLNTLVEILSFRLAILMLSIIMITDYSSSFLSMRVSLRKKEILCSAVVQWLRRVSCTTNWAGGMTWK